MATTDFRLVIVPHSRDCDFVVGRCPFVEIARSDAVTICELHLGLTEGAAMALDEGVIVDLEAKDPQRAVYRVRIRLPVDTETTWRRTGTSGLEECAN